MSAFDPPMQIELSTLVGAGRIKMSIIGQDVLVTRNEVIILRSSTTSGGHFFYIAWFLSVLQRSALELFVWVQNAS